MIWSSRFEILTAGQPQQLVEDSLPVKSVIITALADNTTAVMIGSPSAQEDFASSGEEQGVALEPNYILTLSNVDLNELWIDGRTAGDIIICFATTA